MDADEEIFTVERILSHRSTKKGRLFLVKWLNYPLEDCTWEPQENLFCKHLVAEYWENPRPNRSLKRIIQEDMAKRAREESGGSSPEENSSDEADGKREKRSSTHPATQKVSSEEFNYRAFLKLGFTVSALIVIGFILWNGNDKYYMEQFYARRFQDEHPPHTEH